MALSAGDKLGPYEILAPVGAGGMGEVYRARDPRLNRDVAIKVSAAQFSERFEREAKAIAALNHPHICQIYDVGPNYLVMEYIEGVALKGPLPLDKVVEYGGQILDALDAAHKNGITHRDLKPANILVTKQGIKLLDFGLAKQAGPVKETEATVTKGLTGRGEILGTLQYMSPEQLQSREVDARSDLFSFGCVLYEMLTGKRAFEGASAASLIAAILEREPAPLNLPPPLERVIKKSLAKDPEERFQTARDLKTALNWAVEPQPDGIVIQRGSPWWRVAVAAALVLGAGAAWAVAHFRQSPADERAFRLQIDPPEGGQFVYGNSSGGIALSPDGRTAAYVAAANGKTSLWVRALDAASARPLAGTEGAYYPFWSPDSKSIGFFSRSKLQRVDLAGGAPLTICDVPGGAGRGAAWTSDGRVLLGGLAGALFQVPASGGTASPLTKLDASHGEGSHRWPQLLPGGRFLYWARAGRAEDTAVYAASLGKPAERARLVNTDAGAFYASGGDGKSYLLWMRGGTLVAQDLDVASLRLAGEVHPLADPVARIGIIGGPNVAVSASGVLLYGSSNTSSRLSWLDRTGMLLGDLGEPGEYSTFRLSPDSRRVAISRDAPGGADLWLLEVQRGVSNRFTFHPGINAYPIWSPDGRTIVFASVGSAGSHNLFRKESSGAGNEQRLTQSSNIQDPYDWSGDGRWVLYVEVAPNTGFDLWVLPMTPDGKPAGQARPYLRTPFNETRGRFSPEPSPRWVAYQSDESGRYEVYIQAFPEPGGKFQISTGGGQSPQWGPGGRELFYVSPDLKLMAVSLKLGADSVEPSNPRELFLLPVVDNGWSPYDTSDGQRFLVPAVPRQQASQPLTVIVNWPALLKKGTPAQ
jgi:Tol biopolymer transport system component/predicted Ser/Thr protein kinase